MGPSIPLIQPSLSARASMRPQSCSFGWLSNAPRHDPRGISRALRGGREGAVRADRRGTVADGSPRGRRRAAFDLADGCPRACASSRDRHSLQGGLDRRPICRGARNDTAPARQGRPRGFRPLGQGAFSGAAPPGGEAPAPLYRPLSGRHRPRDRLRGPGLFLPLLPQAHGEAPAAWRRRHLHQETKTPAV